MQTWINRYSLWNTAEGRQTCLSKQNGVFYSKTSTMFSGKHSGVELRAHIIHFPAWPREESVPNSHCITHGLTGRYRSTPLSCCLYCAQWISGKHRRTWQMQSDRDSKEEKDKEKTERWSKAVCWDLWISVVFRLQTHCTLSGHPQRHLLNQKRKQLRDVSIFTQVSCLCLQNFSGCTGTRGVARGVWYINMVYDNITMVVLTIRDLTSSSISQKTNKNTARTCMHRLCEVG